MNPSDRNLFDEGKSGLLHIMSGLRNVRSFDNASSPPMIQSYDELRSIWLKMEYAIDNMKPKRLIGRSTAKTQLV